MSSCISRLASGSGAAGGATSLAATVESASRSMRVSRPAESKRNLAPLGDGAVAGTSRIWRRWPTASYRCCISRSEVPVDD
jgi:hypothetical protein